MNTDTENKLNEIMTHANAGYEIIPAFFQPIRGRSNSVSAAIRHALKNNMLEQCRVDGMGKPKYIKARPANPASPWFMA